jgi:hypothetical protein
MYLKYLTGGGKCLIGGCVEAIVPYLLPVSLYRVLLSSFSSIKGSMVGPSLLYRIYPVSLPYNFPRHRFVTKSSPVALNFFVLPH